jgi:hypothetical protein
MKPLYSSTKTCRLFYILHFCLAGVLLFLYSTPVLAMSQWEVRYWSHRQKMKTLNHDYAILAAEHARYTKAFNKATELSNAAAQRGDQQGAVYYNGIAQVFSTKMRKLRQSMDKIATAFYKEEDMANWVWNNYGPFGRAPAVSPVRPSPPAPTVAPAPGGGTGHSTSWTPSTGSKRGGGATSPNPPPPLPPKKP